MARYNAWQNDGLRDIMVDLDMPTLTQDRGAFFGSIFATLNHLLWGDTLWISRFDGGVGPDPSIKDSVDYTSTSAVWAADRMRVDARIDLWAHSLSESDLTGDLHWHSVAMGLDFTKPKALCVMQLFNHQTHHRGQVHAMLTAIGIKPNDTDLPFMPE
jgi:uncharacterized damage-inducible protein DinB